MYCRVCGSSVNEKSEFCIKCGCRPLNGNSYCQECGAETTEQQEMCVKCGCKLKTLTKNSSNFFENISIDESYDGKIDPRFSGLPQYYQVEFQKIMDSNETYKGKFNLWAFLLAGIWSLSKGCWLVTLVIVLLSLLTYGIGGVLYWFILGFRGTYIYYRHYVKKKQCIF